MAEHALTELVIAAGRAREALWTAARLRRRLARQPEFRGLRVFRSETDEDIVLVLTEWSAREAAAEAEAAPAVAPLVERLQSLCSRWESRRLDPLFHLE